MIEKIILDYLGAALTDVSCMMEVPPEGLTLPCVVIQKTGSSKKNHLYSATFAIQSYADSRYNAALLNERVKAAMDTAHENLDSVTASALNSDYDYTDTTTKNYRYQAVYDIHHY